MLGTLLGALWVLSALRQPQEVGAAVLPKSYQGETEAQKLWAAGSGGAGIAAQPICLQTPSPWVVPCDAGCRPENKSR